MTVTVLLLSLVGAYYAMEGHRYLRLERIAEPAFAVNVWYLLNFPVRALVLLVFGDTMETAPALEWDFDTCNTVLLFATACVLVFNFSYQYFSGARVLPAAPAVRVLPPLQSIPLPMLGYFALWASVVLYFVLSSRTSMNFVNELGESDIPQIVNAAWFALDVSISGSLIMWLITRRLGYLAVFAVLAGLFVYYGFMLTAKHMLLVVLVIFLLILRRVGPAIRPAHLLAALLLAVPFVVASYAVRDFDISVISPDETLVGRTKLVFGLLNESSLGDALTNFFLIKMTGRLAYLDAFMTYLQALDQGVALDLYDRVGSLPTYKLAIPSIFGVDKGAIQNIHVWFANKYWYGLSYDGFGVLVPFGRTTESFMIFGWAGFLMFAFYAWLFAWLYRRFYCSADPAMVIYYLLLFNYYILADDVLLFNFSAIVWGSVFFWGSVFALRLAMKRTMAQATQPEVLRQR